MKKAIESQTPDSKDKITEKLQKQYDRVSERIAKLETTIKEAEETYKATAKYFCENPSDSSEKFGEKVYSHQYIQVLKFWRIILKSKKDQEKIEETLKKEAEKALKASTAPVKPVTAGGVPAAGGLPKPVGFAPPGAFKLPTPGVGGDKPPGPPGGFRLPAPGAAQEQKVAGGFKLPTPGQNEVKAPGSSLLGGVVNIQAMRTSTLLC